MKSISIDERAIELAQYIIDSKDTVRGAAKKFGISKSTVHKDVSERLKKYENETIKCLPKQEIYQFEQSYQYVILCCEDDYYNLLMNYRIHRDMLDVQVYSLIGKQKYEELYQENVLNKRLAEVTAE